MQHTDAKLWACLLLIAQFNITEPHFHSTGGSAWCQHLPSIFLHQWQYYPELKVETTSPGEANTPCWASCVSSLACPLNKQPSLWSLHDREGWHSGVLTGSLSALGFHPAVNKGPSYYVPWLMFLFPNNVLLHFLCPHLATLYRAKQKYLLLDGLLQWKVNTVPGKPVIIFHCTPTVTTPHPLQPPVPAFSISCSPMTHKHKCTATNKPHTIWTVYSHARNRTNTHTWTDRKGWANALLQKKDCKHSRNKYPVLIIKFSSHASLSVGPSAFPGEKYTHLTLSWFF